MVSGIPRKWSPGRSMVCRTSRTCSPNASACGTISARSAAASSAIPSAGKCEGSLRRLKRDVIDLYQIHWPEPDADIEEGWETMAKLKEEGKVRWIGVSNFNAAQMERAQRIAPITSLQPPYNLLTRGSEESILPFARKNGIGVIVYSPMKSGLLTGAMTRERIDAMPEDDFRRNVAAFKEPLLSRNLELAELLKRIGAWHGVSAGVVAIAWTLRNPAVTAAIVGMRSANQAKGVLPALDFRLSDTEADEIESFEKQHA